MIEDLSLYHRPISNLFNALVTPKAGAPYRLTLDQIEFFHTNGYLAGIPLLNDEQVEVLRAESADLTDPAHPANGLFYEFHTNESSDPSKVLFHALGAWRIAPGFHDLLWNPAFVVPASQLLGGAVRFWHDQLFCKPAHHGGVVAWHQAIPIGRELGRWRTCRAGLDLTIPRARTVACITSLAVTNGICCRLRVWPMTCTRLKAS
jgi:hypothetical protein